MKNGGVKLTSLILGPFLAITASAQSRAVATSRQPVAIISGQTIYEDELSSSIEGQLLPLRNQEYEIKKKALDTLIDQKLLEAAAKKKGITTEQLLVQEADSKIPVPIPRPRDALELEQVMDFTVRLEGFEPSGKPKIVCRQQSSRDNV